MVPVGLRPGRGCIVCRLGKAFTGTKAKREQFCILWEERDPVIYRCMLALLAVTDKDDLVFPINGDQYNRLMQKAQMFFFGDEPDMHLTPHSWRAAFVVDGILDGRPASELRSEGRWVSESSFKVYLDVVGALAVQTHAATRASLPAQEGALAELGSRFAAFESRFESLLESRSSRCRATARSDAPRANFAGSPAMAVGRLFFLDERGARPAGFAASTGAVLALPAAVICSRRSAYQRVIARGNGSRAWS